MAIVFISPKERQKMFFIGITVIFLLFLVAISLIVFLSQPPKVQPKLVFNKAKITINMETFDSEKFKKLQLLPQMDIQFSYEAVDKRKKQITGFISSPSIKKAKEDLESRGLIVSKIKEVSPGRDNPFTAYYSLSTIAPTVSKKQNKK